MQVRTRRGRSGRAGSTASAPPRGRRWTCAGRELLPASRRPTGPRDATGQPAASGRSSSRCDGLAAERAQRPLQQRHARGVALGDSDARPSSSRSAARGGPGRGGAAERPRPSPARPVAGRGGRRRSPRRAHRGRSRGPAPGRAVRAASRPSSSSGGASLPRLRANAICGAQPVQPRPLELVERAQLRGGEQPERRVGRAGLELGLRRGQRARSARRAGSGVSSAARSRNAAAAATPPRACARSAERSSSAADRPRRAPPPRGRGARPAGPDRPRDRSPRPARDAPRCRSRTAAAR